MKVCPALFTITATMAAVSAYAATFALVSDTADAQIGLNTLDEPVIGSLDATAFLNGDNNAAYNNSDAASILVFQLPDLGGEALSDANLDFTITGGSWLGLGGSGTIPKGVDLYGLRYDAASTVLTSDYGFGEMPGNGTLLQQEAYEITTNSAWGGTPISTSTNSTGDANLVTWIQSLYDGGAVAGDYAFLRLNLDDGTNNPLYIASGDYTTDESLRPLLTLNTVPEPSTYALLVGLLTLGVILKRRR